MVLFAFSEYCITSSNIGHMSVWGRARSGVIANSCSPTPANCPPQPLCSPVLSRQTRPSWESQLQSSQRSGVKSVVQDLGPRELPKLADPRKGCTLYYFFP